MNTPRKDSNTPRNTRRERRGYGQPLTAFTPQQLEERADDMAARRAKSATCGRCGQNTSWRTRVGWCPAAPGA